MFDEVRVMKLERDLDSERTEVHRLRATLFEEMSKVKALKKRVEELERLLSASYTIPTGLVKYFEKYSTKLISFSKKK